MDYKKLAGENLEFKFGDPLLESHYLCFACGLSHRKVEAGGLWYCPNPLCIKRTVSSLDEETFKMLIKVKEEVEPQLTPEFYDQAIIDVAKEHIKRINIRSLSNKFGL